MTAHPIIFSATMIRALLAGQKTQTRRIVKPRDGLDALAMHQFGRCPYGQPGDLLWVKETFQPVLTPYFDPPDSEWATGKGYQVLYMATDKAVVYVDRDDNVTERRKPSIHMPRWASRLTLRITEVRVQRVQDISEDDARAEGIEVVGGPYSCNPYRNYRIGKAGEMNMHCSAPTRSFMTLWESIYGPGSWDANPWVWALTFDVIHKNVDEVTA